MAIEATKEQSETTVCLTKNAERQSAEYITNGLLINSSGRAHFTNLAFCFGAKDKRPSLSENGIGNAKRSFKSTERNGTYSRPLIRDVLAKTFFSSSVYPPPDLALEVSDESFKPKPSIPNGGITLCLGLVP